MQGHKLKVNWRCMELTEFEFEELLSSAMKDESEVPFKTNDRLMKKLNAKLRYKRIIKAVPASAAACLVIGVVLTSVMYNNQEVYELKGDEVNQGLVIGTIEEKNVTTAQEIVDEKDTKQPKSKKTAVTQNVSADIAQIEAYSGEEPQEIAEPVVEVEEATKTRSISMTLTDYLDNSEELIANVSEMVKEKMSADEYIEYFEDFVSITGNENYYLTEKNELVIIFEPGIVAAEENGEIYINVGVIK